MTFRRIVPVDGPPLRRRRIKREEDTVQMRVFDWLGIAKWRGVPLRDIANGSAVGVVIGGDARQRAMRMARLKRMGVQVGFPDLVLYLPAAPYHGLAIELKKEHGGRLEDSQREWLRKLPRMGYDTHVCEGFEHAVRTITTYVALTGHPIVVGYAPREFDWGVDE